MSSVTDWLNYVLGCLHPGDDVISTARARRDEALAVAERFSGCLRTYPSGSIAHRTANFDTDADCGIVLDRRSYPELGPDGNGIGPEEIVESVRGFVRERLAPRHPNIGFRVTKRAIKITYHEPEAAERGGDPNVDLIVALTRHDAPGLWIPNIAQDRWDPSDPERHTELLTADPKTLRRKRAHVIRLAKGWNVSFSEPAVCSFNVEALALQSVREGTGLAEALAIFFEEAAADLKQRPTPDPAGVSPPIKTSIDRQKAAERFERAGIQLRAALGDGADDCAIRAALSKLFAGYIEPCESDARLRHALAGGGNAFTTGGGLATRPSGQRQRTTRAYGSR